MKLVREHINEKFAEESDPLRDMGIGFNSESLVKALFSEDKKTNLIPNSQEPGNLYSIKITPKRGNAEQAGTRLFLDFYVDTFYIPGTNKRMTAKMVVEYAKSLFKNLGLEDIIIGGENAYHQPHTVLFHINPKYQTHLTSIIYEVS